MRFCLFSLFFLSAGCSGFFLDPPFVDVAIHNNNLAPSLLGVRLHLPGRPPPFFPLKAFYLDPPLLYPAVDANISSFSLSTAVWGWQYDAVGDYGWQGEISGCDSNRSIRQLAGTQTYFEFRSELDGKYKAVSNPTNPVKLPFSSSELSKAQGPLSVWMFGNLTLIYNTYSEIKRCYQICNRFGCRTYSFLEYQNEPSYFSFTRLTTPVHYWVQTPAMSARLLSPFALERSIRLPWMRFYVFSNASVYRIRSELDGSETFNDQRLVFDVAQDATGRRRIKTVVAPLLTKALDVNYQSDSISVTNYSIALGTHQDIHSSRILGLHNLSYIAYDVFGGWVEKNYSISTRDAVNVTLSVSQSTIESGDLVTVFVRLFSFVGGALPEKVVRFRAATFDLAAVTNERGEAQVELALDAPGKNVIRAVFGGDSHYPATSASVLVFVHSEKMVDDAVLRKYDATILGLVFLTGLLLSAGFAIRRF